MRTQPTETETTTPLRARVPTLPVNARTAAVVMTLPVLVYAAFIVLPAAAAWWDGAGPAGQFAIAAGVVGGGAVLVHATIQGRDRARAEVEAARRQRQMRSRNGPAQYVAVGSPVEVVQQPLTGPASDQAALIASSVFVLARASPTPSQPQIRGPGPVVVAYDKKAGADYATATQVYGPSESESDLEALDLMERASADHFGGLPPAVRHVVVGADPTSGTTGQRYMNEHVDRLVAPGTPVFFWFCHLPPGAAAARLAVQAPAPTNGKGNQGGSA